MRFDDSLETVLAADISSPLGMQSAWRQIVDLIGRRRVSATPEALARLRQIRAQVPPPVRAASARAVAQANPPAALVHIFAEDELSIAAPVLRVTRLQASEWIAILPLITSANRSILRHRRDLGPEVGRALESYGPADFVLPPAALTPPDLSSPPDASTAPPPVVEDDTATDAPAAVEPPAVESPAAPPVVEPAPPPVATPAGPPPSDAALRALARVALGLPPTPEVVPAQRPAQPLSTESQDTSSRGTFEIADIVARIDAFQRHRDDVESPTEPAIDESVVPEAFRFETDSRGVVRWVSGASRSALIGLSLDGARQSPAAQVDGVVAGAFRRRASFTDARLLIESLSTAAGQWRISALPVFDRATGRFTGYRGSGRRPRADERADPLRDGRTPGTDAVRQLVHELRTPTTAIAGFAEMIEGEMLGPVPDPYRSYAGAIRHQATGLLGAIDDLDTAARLDSNALELRPGRVALAPILGRVVEDLRPLAALRGARVLLFADPGLDAHGDERAIERMAARLLATMVAAADKDEAVMVTARANDDDTVELVVDRPRALAAWPGEALLSLDPDTAAADDSAAPLLGAGFALRLVRNLALELGGSLAIGADRLTLRLPAAVTTGVGQASTN